MKTLLLRVVVLLVWPIVAFSQAATPELPAPVSTFFKADFSPTTADDSAAFCVETTFRDSLSGVTRVYYPSGRLKQYVPYINAYQPVIHGTLTTWYEDGTMQTKEEYVAGERHGDLLTYYPDGALKRRDRFEKGRGGIGNCYAPDGTHVPYFTYEQLPLYPGGDVGLMAELERGLRRSLSSKEMNAMRAESYQTLRTPSRSWECQVLIELAVAPDGRITGAQVVQSNAPALNGAVLKAVTRLTRQFIPARRDGQVIVSHLVVPVRYVLSGPPIGHHPRPSRYATLPLY